MVRANHSILDAPDIETDSSLPLEGMASNVIKHVNRSHSSNTIADLECVRQKHTFYIHTHGSDTLRTHTHTQASNPGKDKHTDARPPKTDRHRHTHSFRLTTTHHPPLLPAMWLRLPRFAPDAFRLMHSHPHRLSLHPNPQPLNHIKPRCSFSK